MPSARRQPWPRDVTEAGTVYELIRIESNQNLIPCFTIRDHLNIWDAGYTG